MTTKKAAAPKTDSTLVLAKATLIASMLTRGTPLEAAIEHAEAIVERLK
jgi:hypothetical protein